MLYVFDSGHLELLVVMQCCMRVAQVVAETSHRHLITVMQRHRDRHCSKRWDILENKHTRDKYRQNAFSSRAVERTIRKRVSPSSPSNFDETRPFCYFLFSEQAFIVFF